MALLRCTQRKMGNTEHDIFIYCGALDISEHTAIECNKWFTKGNNVEMEIGVTSTADNDDTFNNIHKLITKIITNKEKDRRR